MSGFSLIINFPKQGGIGLQQRTVSDARAVSGSSALPTSGHYRLISKYTG